MAQRYGDARENGESEMENGPATRHKGSVVVGQLQRRPTKMYAAPTMPQQGFVFKPFTPDSLAKIRRRRKESLASRSSSSANKQQQQQQFTDSAKPQPDPYLASGMQLPPGFARQLPADLVGKPIEDIDPYYENQETFVIISRGKEVTRFSATKALYLFGPFHPIRRVVLYILVNPLFSLLVILTILTNCILMTFQGSETVEKTEIFFTIIYTTEMLLKVLARGFVVDEFTYLRDPWNLLDFTVIIMAYLTIVIEDLGNLSVMRTFRVLRALKTVAIIPGMKTIVGAVIDSMKNLKDVVVLTLFSLSVFSLLGLQIYMGVLTQKCINNGPTNMTDEQWFAWNSNSSNWIPEPTSEIFGAYRLCGNATGAQSCPPTHTCLQGFGPNPDYGYTNFDTFGWSLICSFRLMTQDYWEGLYMQVLKTAGSWHIFFFIVSIFLGSIYLMNLILAIVAMSYNELQRRAEQEEEAAAEDEAAFLESCKLMEEQMSEASASAQGAGSSYRPSVEIGLVGQSLLASLCQNGLLGQHVQDKLSKQMVLPVHEANPARSQSFSAGRAPARQTSNKRASMLPACYYHYDTAASMTELRRKGSQLAAGSDSVSGSPTNQAARRASKMHFASSSAIARRSTRSSTTSDRDLVVLRQRAALIRIVSDDCSNNNNKPDTDNLNKEPVQSTSSSESSDEKRNKQVNARLRINTNYSDYALRSQAVICQQPSSINMFSPTKQEARASSQINLASDEPASEHADPKSSSQPGSPKRRQRLEVQPPGAGGANSLHGDRMHHLSVENFQQFGAGRAPAPAPVPAPLQPQQQAPRRGSDRAFIHPSTMARHSIVRQQRPSVFLADSAPRRVSSDFARRTSDWQRLSMSTNVDMRRLLRLWAHTNPYQGRASIGSFSNASQQLQSAGRSRYGSRANSPRPSSLGSSRQAYELISAFSRRHNLYPNDARYAMPLDGSDAMQVNWRDKCIAYCLSCLDVLCIWQCCGLWLKIQRLIALLVFDPFTELFIILCILINTLFMALDSDDADDHMRRIFERGNYFFTATFAVEASMKIMALSPKFYFRDGWNVFDTLIVCLSLLELGLEGVYGLSVLRSFRLLRVFKLAKSWPTLNLLISIMGKAVGDVGNLTFVLAIIVFILAVMGMQLFGAKYTADNFPSGQVPRWNFTDFLHSFMIVFRILCAEWIEPMWDCLLVGGWPCIPFFLIAVTIGNLVVLNLFLALLLASFGASNLAAPQSDNVDTRKLQEAVARFARFGRWTRRRLARGVGWLVACATCRLARRQTGVNEPEPSGANAPNKGKKRVKSHIANMSRLERLKNIELRTEELKSKARKSPERHYHLRQLAKMQVQAAESTSSGYNYNYKQRHYSMQSDARQTEPVAPIPIIVNEAEPSDSARQHRSCEFTNPATSWTQPTSMQPIREDSRDNDSSSSELDCDQDVELPAGSASEHEDSDAEEQEAGGRSSMYLQAPRQEHMEDDDEVALQRIEFYLEKCVCLGIICLKWFLFRRFIRKIVEHKYFDQCILVLIVVSSGTLALEDKHLKERPNLKRTLDVLDTIFTIIFSLEMIFKWLAFGVRRYFSNIWSWLDFIIVLVSFINLLASLLGSGKIQALKTMRTLRAMRGLRPLRALQRFQGMRVVVNALIQAIPSIFNVLLVCLIFWLIFSIMGVQMFGGKFWRCTIPETGELATLEEAANKFECIERNLTWSNQQINFDNVLNAYLALFQVATFKGWIDIMNNAADCRGRDEQPVRETNIFMYFYFVIFVIFGSFFTLNLFIGVIIDNFNEQKKKTGGSLELFMTDDQKKYYHAMKKMRSKRPTKAMRRPKNRLQALMFDITTSKTFDIIIMLIIGLNMFVMSLEHHGQSIEFTLALENLNLFFIGVFTLECLAKIFAMRHFYFREPWNIFDFNVVVLSILGVVMKEYVAKYFVSPTLLRVVRVVKVGRVLRLVKGAKGIRTLLFALAMSLPALFNICLLLFMVMFIYAIFGMQFFQNVRPRRGIDETFNFGTFTSSIIVLFQMSTSAAWDQVLDPLMDEENDCLKPDPAYGIEGTCGNKIISIFYLVSYVIIAFLIIINMYIAIILENYSQASEDVQVGLTEDVYEMYYEKWQKYDPDGTQLLPYTHLSDFVAALEWPLKLPKPNELALVAMDIPIYRGDLCYCVDILDALTKLFFTRRGLCIQPNEHLEEVQLALHATPFERITTTYMIKRENYCARIIQNCWRRWKERTNVPLAITSGHEDS